MSEINQATHGYAGFCACGCGAIVAGTVDIPSEKDSTADFVAELIRGGMRVERLPLDEIRMRFCKCERPAAPEPQLALELPPASA